MVFIQTFILLVFLLKAQELFIAGFGSLLAMTASLYSRYKLHVNSIHRQSEAALEAQNALEAMSGWRQQGPEWVMVPKITRDRDPRGVTRKHFPPLSLPLCDPGQAQSSHL